MPGVHRCAFDLLDRDKILRVETTSIAPWQIQQLVEAHGYFCRGLGGCFFCIHMFIQILLKNRVVIGYACTKSMKNF
jgi:hypothetical protein